MKSSYVRLFSGATTSSRAGFSSPREEKVNSKTVAFDAPPTYTFDPSGENASPSHASATGTRETSCGESTVNTLTDGGLYPPFSTSRNFPSFESADDIGSVSSGTCAPAGFNRHPFERRKLPSGCRPTRSCQEGCEHSIPAQITTNRTPRRCFILNTSVRLENAARCRTLCWSPSGRARPAAACIRCDPLC